MSKNPLHKKSQKPDPQNNEENEGLFRELNEEMRQDQVIKFIKKYQYYVIGTIAAIAIGYGAFLAYDSYRDSQNKNRATIIAQARSYLSQEDPSAGIKLLEDLAQGKDFYSFEAGMILGKRALSEGEADKAKSYFDNAANNTKLGAPYKTLAQIYGLTAATDLGLSDADKANLDAFASSEGEYQDLAIEIQIMGMLKDGKTEEALAEIDRVVAIEELQSTVRNRLTLLKNAIE